MVFFAVGFETTAPATALAAREARRLGLANFSMLVAHVLVPPAMEAILASPTNRVQGFLAAGHVCTVMGFEEYPALAERYRVPIVVTGFEPVDLLEGILMVVRQLEVGPVRGREPVRPLGPSRREPPGAGDHRRGLRGLRPSLARPGRAAAERPAAAAAYRDLDAEARFAVASIRAVEPPECRSGEVLQGLIHPGDCAAFGTLCTPDHPLGAPMVSSEGACAAYWKYGRGSGKAPRPTRRGFPAMTTASKDPSPMDPDLSCPVPRPPGDRVLLAHGEGAGLTRRLIREVLLAAFDNEFLRPMADGAVLPAIEGRVVLTTDSYVVSPLFFPGGDIGKLAVYGTVNDLAVCGAEPLYLSLALIVEEGLPHRDAAGGSSAASATRRRRAGCRW